MYLFLQMFYITYSLTFTIYKMTVIKFYIK